MHSRTKNLDGQCDFCHTTQNILYNYLDTHTAMCQTHRAQLLTEYSAAVKSNEIQPADHIDTITAWCRQHVDLTWYKKEPEGA